MTDLKITTEKENSNIFLKFAELLAICITVYYLLPIAAYFIKGVFINIIFIFWILFACIGIYNIRKELLLTIVFLIVFSISIIIMNTIAFNRILIENVMVYINFFIPICFFLFYIRAKPKFLSRLAVIAIITLIITSATTLVQLINNFYISKLLTSDLHENKEVLLKNVANINLLQSYVVICPLLLALSCGVNLKVDLKWRMVSSVLFAFYLYTVFRASFSIIMIVILFGCGFMLFKKNSYAIVTGSVLFAITLLFKNEIASYLYNISSTNFNELYAQRIQEIALFLMGNEPQGDFRSRLTLYYKSIEVFLRSPILGLGNGQYFNYDFAFGGHSEWLDTLAKLGLCFGGLLFIVLYKEYRIISQHMKRFMFERETKACFSIFLLYGLLNMTLTFPVSSALFIVLPGLVMHVKKRRSKNINETSNSILA